MSGHPTLELAAFVAETPFDAVPDEALHPVRRCIINILAVVLHAAKNPALETFLDVFTEEGGSARASVLGTSARTSLQNAALANGFLAHLDDFDDTLLPTVFHPSAPIVPAALAIAEAQRRSGRDFLTACTLALETACRVAMTVRGMQHQALWHMTGTVGVFGAAAAAARLYGLGMEDTARALGIAGTQASGLRQTFGTMTKAFHAGRASQSGLLAALLARRGLTSTASILEGPHGFVKAVCGGGARLSDLTDSLGKAWVLRDIALKPYASGILSHAAIDAMRALRGDIAFEPTQIAHIIGRVNPLAVTLESRPDPKTGLEARLSLQHAMAVALIDGAASPAQFTDDRVNDRTVMDVRRKIELVAESSIEQHACEVSLLLTDGRTCAHRIDHASGTLENPLSDEKLNDKFRSLAAGVLHPARIDELLALLWGMEDVRDVSDIVNLCGCT